MTSDDWKKSNASDCWADFYWSGKNSPAAETLVPFGCEGMHQRETMVPTVYNEPPRKVLRRLVQLYEA